MGRELLYRKCDLEREYVLSGDTGMPINATVDENGSCKVPFNPSLIGIYMLKNDICIYISSV